MNTIREIRSKYNISNSDLANILNVNKSTISTILDRDIDTLNIKQLCSLKEYTKSTFNELLGEKVFTPNNIDSNDSIQAISILDNDKEYSRLFNKLKEDLKKELTKDKY